MTDYQCPSCGGICKKSGCERADIPKAILSDKDKELAKQFNKQHSTPQTKPEGYGKAVPLSDEKLELLIKKHEVNIEREYGESTPFECFRAFVDEAAAQAATAAFREADGVHA